MLAYVSHMLTYAGISWRMLAYASICWHMPASACVCRRMPAYASICQHTPAYAGICNTGPKLKIQYGAKAENTIWGQSREYKRRPMLKVLADHMMVVRLYIQDWPPLVFSALAPFCIYSFWPILYFVPLVLPALLGKLNKQ